MYLLNMRPQELQDCVSKNIPLIMALGVVEHHGLHLPVGTDMLITRNIVAQIEQRCSCIVAPELPYGPTMNWSGTAKEGTIDFDRNVFLQYQKEILKHLLKVGFRRIYILYHHQGNDGAQYLSAALAARQAIDDFTRNWTDGWGRKHDSPEPHIFGAIQLLGLTANEKCPWEIETGHASKGETQLMLYYNPAYVEMDKLQEYGEMLPPWMEDSHLADVEKAKKDMDFCVAAWVKELGHV